VEATLSGDRPLALQVLLGEPLMRNWHKAPAMLDEATANRAYLPHFV
jgi:alpha-galactosidase/6-phospho-beta-glucosidase family protein